MPTSHRSRSRGEVQKYHPLCLEKYLWLEYCNAISLQLKPKNWWVQILSLQVILNKKSSQRDFWHFDIYFSWICAWEFFELISQVRSFPTSFLLCQQASILWVGIFFWFRKYSVWSRGPRAPRSAQRNSVCAQRGLPWWKWLTTTRIWATTCSDSRIQAKPLNVGSSDLGLLKFHRAVIIALESTSGSYIVFTPCLSHH